jgi:hypothetical protein
MASLTAHACISMLQFGAKGQPRGIDPETFFLNGEIETPTN